MRDVDVDEVSERAFISGGAGEELKRQLDRLRSGTDLRWDATLLDALDPIVAALLSDDDLPAIAVRAARQHSMDPEALKAAHARHQHALKRARRHRNLAAHGHEVDERVYLPTAMFLADQLEFAIRARVHDRDGDAKAWTGSHEDRTRAHTVDP